MIFEIRCLRHNRSSPPSQNGKPPLRWMPLGPEGFRPGAIRSRLAQIFPGELVVLRRFHVKNGPFRL